MFKRRYLVTVGLYVRFFFQYRTNRVCRVHDNVIYEFDMPGSSPDYSSQHPVRPTPWRFDRKFAPKKAKKNQWKKEKRFIMWRIITYSIQINSSVYHCSKFVYYKCAAQLEGEIYEKWTFKISRAIFCLRLRSTHHTYTPLSVGVQSIFRFHYLALAVLSWTRRCSLSPPPLKNNPNPPPPPSKYLISSSWLTSKPNLEQVVSSACIVTEMSALSNLPTKLVATSVL